MNAKMIITVPIEEIPDEVSKILERIVEKLSSVKEKINNCVYSPDHSLVISEIDEARKMLSLIDLNMEDSYSVLLGYIKYQTDKKVQQLENNNSTKGDNDANSNNG